MKNYYILSFFLLSFTFQLKASEPIILSDTSDVKEVRGVFIDFLKDTSHQFTIKQLTSPDFKNKFNTGQGLEVILNEDLKATYWLRIKVINQSTSAINWVAELYDFRIEHVEVYLFTKNDITFISKGGANFPFKFKNYQHKNFIYNLPIQRGDTTFIFYKIKAEKQVSFIGRIRSYERLLQYSNNEYFCLALFYGVVIAMILYNLFLFLALQDINYLYYVLYVTSIGIYSLNSDGLGFQYLWPNHPEWNDYVFPIANFSMTIWALLYGRSFLYPSLQLKKWLLDGFIIFIGIRVILFLFWLHYPFIANIIWLDLIPFIYIYFAGIVSLISGNRMARFYVLAFTMFFSGIVFSILRHYQLVFDNILSVYSFNIGVLLEMILLSFALADRIKMITLQKEKELELTVVERTQELENKNKELDTLVYRSSHDIKGPIKSIIGLASLGIKENNPSLVNDYLQHILKSSKKLDSVVDHLVSVIEIKESKLDIGKINFKVLINKVIFKCKGLPHFNEIDIHINVSDSIEFYSDEKVLYGVFENLISNSIRNYDTKKSKPFLKIDIRIGKKYASIDISDNGQGLDDISKEKIFDILYSMNQETSDAGMGLYMTKLLIDKLEGSMVLHSEEGSGSAFNINLKNHIMINPVLENTNPH